MKKFLVLLFFLIPVSVFSNDLTPSSFKFTNSGWDKIAQNHESWNEITKDLPPVVAENFDHVYFDYNEVYSECLKRGKMLTVIKGISKYEEIAINAKLRGDLVYLTQDDSRFEFGISRFTVNPPVPQYYSVGSC